MMKIPTITTLLSGAALTSRGRQVFGVRQFGAIGKRRADHASKAIRDALEALLLSHKHDRFNSRRALIYSGGAATVFRMVQSST